MSVMIWSEVKFGKHEGKTLPQILFSDPDWFFWAIEKNIFMNRGTNIQSQANDLYDKARNIKIPNNEDENLVVEYISEYPSGKFSRFEIIPKNTPYHTGSSPTSRSPMIDMSIPRRMAKYDKTGCKNLLTFIKRYFFGKSSARLTKQRCEDFFSDSKNFANNK